MQCRTAAFLAVVFVGAAAQPLRAQVPFPSLYPAGTEFRLFFTTEGRTTATSTDIEYYDAFVQSEAERSPLTAGLEWFAFANTQDDYISFANPEESGTRITGLNLFRLRLLFPDHTEFFEVDWSNCIFECWNPYDGWWTMNFFPDVDQFGNRHSIEIVSEAIAWTGWITPLGNDQPSVGDFSPYIEGYRWLAGGTRPAATELPIYAVSEWLVAVSPPPQGDWNDDGKVDQADLDMVMLNWGDLAWGFVGTRVARVSQAHLDAVLLGWGTSTPPASVPEPSAWLLLAVGGGLIALRHFGR